MNLILHQFKTDLAHFRWRLSVLWFSFAAEAALAVLHALSGMGTVITTFFIEIWQAFFAVVLIAALVQSDALVGDTAAWLTRPMRRIHLFWAKTAFVVLCFLMPWLVIKVLGWTLLGYSWHQALLAAEQSLLLGGTFVVIVAVLAALTRDLGRFFLAGGIMIAGIFASVLGVEMLVHAGLLHEAHFAAPEETQRNTSAVVVGWLALAAGALVAWGLQACAGRWRAAVVWLAAGFLAYPCITTVWSKNLLSLNLTATPPLAVTLLETNDISKQSQVISTEMALTGVPEGRVATIQDISANLLINGDSVPTSLRDQGVTVYNGPTRPTDSGQRGNYFDTIKGFFPSNTIWFNEDYNGAIFSEFSSRKISERVPREPATGNLYGNLTVNLFAVKEVAEEPLAAETFQALPGLRVTISKIRVAGNTIIVSLDECSVNLMLDREVDANSMANNHQPFCTYVLYHPESGEAFIVHQGGTGGFFPPMLSGESHQGLVLRFSYPTLRGALAGVSAADWIREARLCVFAPLYDGTSQLAFQQENYQWPPSGGEGFRGRNGRYAGAQSITDALLPADPTATQLNGYLDEILLNLPENWDDATSKTIREKLAAIGINGLPALLRRLPTEPNFEDSFVIPAVNKLITRDQLPDLLAALQRDNDVVAVFQKKHWEADARGVLIAKLGDHREPLPPEALYIAAQAKDSDTYADLRWHFIHLNYGQAHVLEALAACPGFDTNSAIGEAWQNAQLGIIDSGQIAPIAAALGLPDALNQAVIHTESMYDTSTRQRALADLASLTGYNGPTSKTLVWLASNLEHLQFDAAQKRYLLTPAN